MSELGPLAKDYLEQAWLKQDYELLRQFVTADFAYRLSISDETRDFNWYIRFLESIHESFSDLSLFFHDVVESDETVAAHYTFAGRHDKPVFGVEAKGNRGYLEVMSFLKFRKGKIYAQASVTDFFSLRSQMLA